MKDQQPLVQINSKEANWVPIAKDEDFFLCFRIYGRKKAVFDKSWKLKELVKVD